MDPAVLQVVNYPILAKQVELQTYIRPFYEQRCNALALMGSARSISSTPKWLQIEPVSLLGFDRAGLTCFAINDWYTLATLGQKT